MTSLMTMQRPRRVRPGKRGVLAWKRLFLRSRVPLCSVVFHSVAGSRVPTEHSGTRTEHGQNTNGTRMEHNGTQTELRSALIHFSRSGALPFRGVGTDMGTHQGTGQGLRHPAHDVRFFVQFQHGLILAHSCSEYKRSHSVGVSRGSLTARQHRKEPREHSKRVLRPRAGHTISGRNTDCPRAPACLSTQLKPAPCPDRLET